MRLMLVEKIFAGLAIGLSFLRPGDSFADESWYSCQTVSQCTVIKGGCGVEWAVNKRFAEQSRKQPPREDYLCKKPKENHLSDSFPICADGKCTIYPSGTCADGKKIDPDNCVIASCWGKGGCNYLSCTHPDGSKFTKYAE